MGWKAPDSGVQAGTLPISAVSSTGCHGIHTVALLLLFQIDVLEVYNDQSFYTSVSSMKTIVVLRAPSIAMCKKWYHECNRCGHQTYHWTDTCLKRPHQGMCKFEVIEVLPLSASCPICQDQEEEDPTTSTCDSMVVKVCLDFGSEVQQPACTTLPELTLYRKARI